MPENTNQDFNEYSKKNFEEYFFQMDFKDDYKMPYRFLYKAYKDLKKRSLDVTFYEEDLKNYDQELYNDLKYIYFHPEIEMIRYAFEKEYHLTIRRKLLLANYLLWEKRVKDCNENYFNHEIEYNQFRVYHTQSKK